MKRQTFCPRCKKKIIGKTVRNKFISNVRYECEACNIIFKITRRV